MAQQVKFSIAISVLGNGAVACFFGEGEDYGRKLPEDAAFEDKNDALQWLKDKVEEKFKQITDTPRPSKDA